MYKTLCLLMILLISCPLSIFAQSRTITGTVRDAMDVVIGASVKVKGSSGGTITDLNGNFSLFPFNESFSGNKLYQVYSEV